MATWRPGLRWVPPIPGGQVVYVLELLRKLAHIGYDLDIWTRRFDGLPEIDLVDRGIRVIRARCGGPGYVPKEFLYRDLEEWCGNALRFIKRQRLNYQFSEVMADGVLDGLRHYGVINERPTAADTGTAPERMEPAFRMLFTGTVLGLLTDDEKALLRTGYEMAVAAVRRNITPLGFSACSLADNSVRGTDANYRSVWARDGAITVLGMLDLQDPRVLGAARNTLETLLDAIAPFGQVPTNVRVEDGKPDYSGVGNIASIDSGLWLIIAVHGYYLQTQDIAFLRKYGARLQRAMDWLSAHDSNNDGLLEIPEAGDWTDLFGRSYNVLYDEVLWFRANVCFGRLLEFLGEPTRAAAYLHWSQHIRTRVLETFWPTTTAKSELRPNQFAERQSSLGDTQYLIAEVTPFSFNWRCDTFGNILAFLMNLLDVDRARQAFQFMWGVGVNQPWPVANLYPVVQAGDPDCADTTRPDRNDDDRSCLDRTPRGRRRGGSSVGAYHFLLRLHLRHGVGIGSRATGRAGVRRPRFSAGAARASRGAVGRAADVAADDGASIVR